MDDLFECTRHTGGLRLTRSACGRMHIVSRQGDEDRLLDPCRYCEIGAKNAGVDFQRESAIDIICARCHRKSKRLIFGSLCPSCYNRQREYIVGRDRRGKRPMNHPGVRRCCIGVMNKECQRVETRSVVSPIELFVTAARDERAAAFLRPIDVLRVV